MKLLGSCIQSFIRSVILLLGLTLLLSAPASISGAQQNTDFKDSFNQKHPGQIVIQIIDNELYKWFEFIDQNNENHLTVYLLEPESKLLDPAETRELLQASRKWEEQLNLTSLSTRQIELENLVDSRTAIENSKSIVYPYNTIGILMIDFASEYIRGTGFLISPYTVLTNAHNLYSSSLGGWHRTARFSPGQYETTWPESVRPFSTLQPVKFEVNQTFLRFESYNDRENLIRYDYAALFFDQPFNGINTFMPLQFDYIPATVAVVGYPGFIRGAPSQGQWLAEGIILSHDNHCLFYDAFTSGGSSGSPVFEYNVAAGTYRVIAIHSFAYENQQISGGPHLNSLNLELIESWLRWTPDLTNNPTVMLALDKTTMTLSVGGIEALVVSITPAEFSDTVLIWASSNSSVASVDSNGLVTAHQSGTAIISVKTADGSSTASCVVTVSNQSGSGEAISANTPGDLNGDRLINIQDVILAYQHVLQLKRLPNHFLPLADVNNDGLVDVRDVSLIMRYSLDLISNFQ
jgi:V8-like Glu-specific endopeptidase